MDKLISLKLISKMPHEAFVSASSRSGLIIYRVRRNPKPAGFPRREVESKYLNPYAASRNPATANPKNLNADS